MEIRDPSRPGLNPKPSDYRSCVLSTRPVRLRCISFDNVVERADCLFPGLRHVGGGAGCAAERGTEAEDRHRPRPRPQP